MFCKQCGKPIDDGQELCADCKASANTSTAQSTQNAQASTGTVNANAKSKLAGGLLGIFLGGLGVHNFYLGYTGKAVAQLLISLLSCGFLAPISSIWGLIEGILILTGSINVDAQGNALRD